MSISTVLNLSTVYQQLTNFANLGNFWQSFEAVYGTQYNTAIATSLQSQWQTGDFSQLPTIEIVDSSILGNAKAAYGTSNNTIYLSNSFVDTASQDSLNAVILEEIGHFIDAIVNTIDTAGDEGEYFASVVQGVSLSAAKLEEVKTENDQATIVINGQILSVEQANFSLGSIDKPTISDSDTLSVSNPSDIWSFKLLASPGTGSQITLTSPNTFGNLTLELYDQSNSLIAQSANPGNSESISLTGLAAGNYSTYIQHFLTLD